MHNMGIVILHLATPEQAIGIDKELPKAKPFERAAREREVHGMDHGEAATILAKKWNFPADIQVALAEYPRESGGSDLAVTLRAAACVAAAVEQGCDELTLATALPPEMLLAVKLDSAWLAKQHEKFQQLQEESASLL
jgi:HD-like signal output (HDOD) protein